MNLSKMVGMAVMVAVSVVGIAAGAEDSPSYFTEVKPILAKYCGSCHNSKTAKASTNLDTYETIMRGGRNKRPLIVPGEPDKSRLLLCVENKQTPAMPPRTRKQPLPAEKQLLRNWITAGAPNDTTLALLRLNAWPQLGVGLEYGNMDLFFIMPVVPAKKTGLQNSGPVPPS